MKVIVVSIGSRGDMEPFLAIGSILQKNGHEVVCLFPEQFRLLAEDTGLRFESLGHEFIDMLDSPAGKIAMGGGPFGLRKMKAYKQLISMQKEINKKMIIKQESVITNEKPDRIVHNGKAIYPVIWSIENRDKAIFVSPVPYLHYVKDHAHVMFNKNLGSFLNKLTYKLANFGLLKTIMSSVKWLEGVKKISQRELQRTMFSNRAMYTISPALFSQPDYWPANLSVVGYHERKKTSHWKPSIELESFVNKHDKMVLVTFGSMVNNNPAEKTNIILEVLQEQGIPAIVNVASGGLIIPQDYDKDMLFFVDRIPYDWAFPKMYAVVHHGGSGTTHAGLKNACPTLLVPHIVDQYVWNTMIFEKGLGPLGVDVSKLNRSNFSANLADLMSNVSYKDKAIAIATKMAKENYEDIVYQSIVQEIN